MLNHSRHLPKSKRKSGDLSYFYLVKRVLLVFFLAFALAAPAQVTYDCSLWGMAGNGGKSGWGTLFSYSINGDSIVKRADFLYDEYGGFPRGPICLASSGLMYGLCWAGGTSVYNGNGTSCPGCGTMVVYDPDTDSLKKLFDFDFASGPGGLPHGRVLEVNGKFYGMNEEDLTNAAGSIFVYDPTSQTMNVAHRFNPYSDGQGPQASLFRASDGNLYGTAWGGGIYTDGTLFKFDPTSGILTKLYDFYYAQSGKRPMGDLIQASNGLLYGMASGGGQYNNGTLFCYDITTNTFTKKIDFNNLTGGYSPQGSLLEASNGKLYGLLSKGGTYNYGTLFEYDISSNQVTTLHNFDYSSGKYPLGSLMEAHNGKLYGVTSTGGASSGGTLFEFDITTNTFTKKADFTHEMGYNCQNIRLVETCTPVYPDTLNVTLPNIFTPNNDGINDSWGPLIHRPDLLKSMDLVIYNRWGAKVYQSSDKNASWNGSSVTGQSSADGTYYYVLEYAGVNSRNYQVKGFITLTR